MSTLPAINPRKMQTPPSTPVAKPKTTGAPQKDMGAMYPLPALIAAKLQAELDGTAKSLDNEFILEMPESQKTSLPKIALPKLALPNGKFIEPEEGAMAPRHDEPETTLSEAEMFEQQVEDFKADLYEDNKWR